MNFDAKSWIGRSETVQDSLTRSLIDRYRATLGGMENETSVPLGIHWCLGTPSTPLAELGVDGHPQKGGFLPPIDLPRRMWAASQVSFISPLQMDASFHRTSTVKDVVPKKGSSGDLVFVTVEHVTSSDESVCIRELQTIVYREQSSRPQTLPEESGFSKTEAIHTETITPTPQLLFRYSALTFNTHRIHYDPNYAAFESYPELVVHGPLMASLLLGLATKVIGQNAIETFEFRGRSPAYCGQDIHLCFGFPDDPELMEVRGADGRLVMSANVTRR